MLKMNKKIGEKQNKKVDKSEREKNGEKRVKIY